jgi:hypothetical protein
MGVQANTVYVGYAPASSITLSAEVAGGSGSYVYEWSNGATTPAIKVNPKANTTYTVTVKDTRGCAATATKEVKVVDVRCGNKMDKVVVCKVSPGNSTNRKSQCVNANAVPLYLASGSVLGSCGNEEKAISISATPNPTTSYFTLTINSSDSEEKIMLSVSNMMGRVIEMRQVVAGQTLQIGSNYGPGLYFIEVRQGREKETVKLLKAGR